MDETGARSPEKPQLKSSVMNEDGFEKREDHSHDHSKDEIHSKVVRAGKRTYFFDVKATRKNDYYLTITESKKRFGRDGKFFYEKHKLFLYKEDFDKFADCLEEVIEYIRQENPQPIEDPAHMEATHQADAEVTMEAAPESTTEATQEEAVEEVVEETVEATSKDFTSVEFEDLDDSVA